MTDEYFELLNSVGNPAGQTKARIAVHRDGDWHRAFHCIVIFDVWSADPLILFQRRSSRKDTWPGRLDVSVGGHYRAGESRIEVVREIREELGLCVADEEIIPLGVRRIEGFGPTWIDREFQDVHALQIHEAFPARLCPSAEEISELHLIAQSAIDELFSETSHVVTSRMARVEHGGVLEPTELASLTIDDFIPVTDDYWRTGTRAGIAVLRGIAAQGSFFR